MQAPAPNLLPNPSFEMVEPPPPTLEQALTGTPAPPDSWLPRTWDVGLEGDAQGTCPDDPAQAHSGSRCAHVQATQGRAILRFGPLPVPQAATWTVRLWARGRGGLVVGGFLTFPERWERMAQETTLDLGPEWQAFDCAITPDPACGWWMLEVATQGPTEAWLDDVLVTWPGLMALDLPPGRELARDEHTLLYLPFDDSLGLDGFFQQGEVGLSEANGGRFGRSLVLGRGSYVAGPASDYLRVAAGTIEMWVRPGWPGDDRIYHNLLGIPGPNGMSLCKDQYGHVSLSFGVGWGTVARAWADGYANRWRPGVWRHVAACWDRQSLQVFVDGKLVACAQQLSLPQMLGPELKLGDPMMQLDDLRISDCVRYHVEVPPASGPAPGGGTLPRSG